MRILRANQSRSQLLYGNGDFFGYDWRLEWIVFGVAQHELKGMFAGWKFEARLRLARPEMEMRLVLWNWLVGIERFIHIDQQMVMAAVFEIISRVRYAHVAQTEATPKSAFDRQAVLRPHEIKKGIVWRGLSLSVDGAGQ